MSLQARWGESAEAFMTDTLFLSNLVPEVSEEEIRALCADFGALEEVLLFSPDAGSRIPHGAYITFSEDEAAEKALEQLNGYVFYDQRLSISWAAPERLLTLDRNLEKAVRAIGARLKERELFQLRKMVEIGGLPFVNAIVEEALELDKSGGLYVLDGTRRRTPGGIFFFLARGRISPAMRTEFYRLRRTQRKKRTPLKAAEGEPTAEPKPKKDGAKAGDKGKRKGGERSKQKEKRLTAAVAERRPAAPPTPPPNSVPSLSADEVKHRLGALQRELSEAQQNLKTLRDQPATKQSGLFSAIKAVTDLQKEIEALRRQYPGV